MARRGHRKRKNRRPKRRTFQCPWCGRTVGFSRKKNIEPHINQAGNPCVGQGMSSDAVEILLDRENQDEKA